MGGALLALTALWIAPATVASPTAAASCSDIEVVFARGTGEPAGAGRVGNAFVSALSSQVGGRSVSSYGVNYPANKDFLTAADGANDASNHIQDMMSSCPDTKLVLGGYSQGAAVIDVITDVPITVLGFNRPLPGDATDHIAALAVFGNPSDRLGHPLTSSAAYGGKAIDLCNDGDPVCSDGSDMNAHKTYTPGMTNQAATFVAGLL